MSGLAVVPRLSALDICELRTSPHVARTNFAVAVNHALSSHERARQYRRDSWQARDEGQCDFARVYRQRATDAFVNARLNLGIARFWKAHTNG